MSVFFETEPFSFDRFLWDLACLLFLLEYEDLLLELNDRFLLLRRSFFERPRLLDLEEPLSLNDRDRLL